MKDLFFIGAGGHFKVAYLIAKLDPNIRIAGFYDDQVEKEEFYPKRYPKKSCYPYNEIQYFGSLDKAKNLVEECLKMKNKRIIFFCSIGDNKIRKRITREINKVNPVCWATLIHPSAVVSIKPDNIGEGTLICACSVVEPGSIIGSHCIINTSASVNHDCQISDYVHICPGSTLCGNVTVQENTMIGAGTTVIPKIKIGSHSIIGSGSNVIRDIPSHTLAYGNPCKEIKRYI